MSPSQPRSPIRLLLGALALAGACTSPRADPGYYLVTPYSQAGQLALDLRYWTVKAPGSAAMLWPELGLRYGVNSRWTSELFLSGIGTASSGFSQSSWNWQNDVLLTQGESPFDLALHSQLIRNLGDQPSNALEWGPALQTEWGLTQLNLNLILAHEQGSSKGTQLKYQWQALYRLDTGLRWGVQGFGELGNWRHWAPQAKQSHRAGPVLHLGLPSLFGSGTQAASELSLAYLFGKTYGHAGDMFSAQLLLPF
ncbi:hypothetical protein DBR47_09555 [Paucibacter sp. KBW04]|uniref:hypothetical protein n=1 Tax=Paucibacter sp. KBW04 TaxID=2153361 RepID=UPI000F57CC61|nr:hypothetical protein [Paucibacter sp. KBW04]RQO60579.1 hypothetical protein DBR47_09555 [Paucibacter sp. KBW04]